MNGVGMCPLAAAYRSRQWGTENPSPLSKATRSLEWMPMGAVFMLSIPSDAGK